MDKLWVVAFKDIRTRFTDRRLLIIMFAAPLVIATIIGLAFGGLGRSGSPVSHIPVAVINYDQPNVYGISYGVMLSNLFTEGQLPADTNSSLAACPQNASQSDPGSNWDSMTLADLIQGTDFNEAVAHQLIADKKIEPPSLPIDNPDYLSATAKHVPGAIASDEEGPDDVLTVARHQTAREVCEILEVGVLGGQHDVAQRAHLLAGTHRVLRHHQGPADSLAETQLSSKNDVHLRFTICDLRFTIYDLRFSIYDFRLDQGISKAGNERVRVLVIELAWGGLRHQPDSALSREFEQRYGSGSTAQRKIGITALARKLHTG